MNRAERWFFILVMICLLLILNLINWIWTNILAQNSIKKQDTILNVLKSYDFEIQEDNLFNTNN